MKLNLDHNEFVDFICVLLYDVMKNQDYLTKNERFNDLLEDLERRGVKNLLFKYYLQAPSYVRKQYKTRFKDVLDDDSRKPGTLFIYPTFDDIMEDINKLDLNNEQKELLIEQLKE